MKILTVAFMLLFIYLDTLPKLYHFWRSWMNCYFVAMKLENWYAFCISQCSISDKQLNKKQFQLDIKILWWWLYSLQVLKLNYLFVSMELEMQMTNWSGKTHIQQHEKAVKHAKSTYWRLRNARPCEFVVQFLQEIWATVSNINSKQSLLTWQLFFAHVSLLFLSPTAEHVSWAYSWALCKSSSGY